MSRTMYDSVNPLSIPQGATMVAGYLDGKYAWSPEDWARFPTAVRVGIACFAATNDGHVLDVENGNASPGQAPGWVRMRRLAGCDPTVYCNRDSLPAVQQAFALSGIAPPHFWIADPDDGPNLYAGSVATQWGYHGTYDESVVADYWPGVDNGQTWPLPAAPAQPAAPPPPPAPEPGATPAPAPVQEPAPTPPVAAQVSPPPVEGPPAPPVTQPTQPGQVTAMRSAYLGSDGTWHLLTEDALVSMVRRGVAAALSGVVHPAGQ